jgi:prepilin-type N-terminal cleavage/methylation domain-containing protein
MSCVIAQARGQRGVTLVELIIVIVVMGILAAVGSSIISDTFKTSTVVNASQASADQARYAVERLAREIREVKYSGTAYSISSTLAPSSTNMVFTRTINGADVTVTINKSGTTLTLGYSSPAASSTLSSQVSGFTLNFLKLDNTATASATDVRFVVISLTVTDATSGQAITERTRVALRNAV